jgi:tryptophan 2,3-dioxygenase
MQAAHQLAPRQDAAPGEPMTYGRYLCLDELLGLQRPLSASHDETLFIVIHQASELWLKLCLHELQSARAALAADDLRPALKMLARAVRVQEQLAQSWSVLDTMTPADYLSFRESLGTSSGFQSHQYRLLEFVLGNRNATHVARHAGQPEVHARLRAELARPSLYDEALRLLRRRGLAIPADVLQRDLSRPHAPSREVEAAWAVVYRNTGPHWDLYELAEKLVDLEDRVQRWRFGHLRTVERIIGFKPGTGGTPGVPYLARVLEQRFFPELFSVRTCL